MGNAGHVRRQDITDASKARDPVHQSVSFMLDVLFDAEPKPVNIRIAQSLFHSLAHVILVPRSRPVLGCALSVGDFFSAAHSLIQCRHSWREHHRVEDASWASLRPAHQSKRIRAGILLDVDTETAYTRRADASFVVRVMPHSIEFQSCTIVYDETASDTPA